MIAAALLAASVQAVPPPVAQLTANCAAPVYATDQLVCGDPALKAQDAAMAASLARLPVAAVDGLAPWLESQADWFRRRSLCAFRRTHRQCVADAYAERTEVLGALARAPALLRYRCGDVGGTLLDSGALLVWHDGKPAGVAVRQPGRSGWLPYLLLDGTVSRLRVTPAGRKPVGCTRERP